MLQVALSILAFIKHFNGFTLANEVVRELTLMLSD